MKLSNVAIPLLGSACITTFVWVTSAAEQPNEAAIRAFMRGKLDAAENVLEGLVTEDFELIQQGSDRMKVMSQRAEWNVFATPLYQQHSDDFRRAANRLSRAAKDEELEAASLAYLQVTLSCINCHKKMRGAKVADLGHLHPTLADASDSSHPDLSGLAPLSQHPVASRELEGVE